MFLESNMIQVTRAKVEILPALKKKLRMGEEGKQQVSGHIQVNYQIRSLHVQ